MFKKVEDRKVRKEKTLTTKDAQKTTQRMHEKNTNNEIMNNFIATQKK